MFLRKTDPPSIPSPGKSYGYEEANDGSLKPQKMPDRDQSMGPAYYNVDHVSNKINPLAVKRILRKHNVIYTYSVLLEYIILLKSQSSVFMFLFL